MTGLRDRQIFWGLQHLSGCSGLSNLRVRFFDHCGAVKGYLALTYWIKNQSTGVP